MVAVSRHSSQAPRADTSGHPRGQTRQGCEGRDWAISSTPAPVSTEHAGGKQVAAIDGLTPRLLLCRADFRPLTEVYVAARVMYFEA